MPHYDLHTHTNFSDGKHSPEVLINLAQQAGITHLAITDHDTVAAHRHLAGIKKWPIDVIAGIELSCQWNGACIHIVGLNIDIHSPAIVQAEAFQTQARNQRLEVIANQLQKQGFDNILQGSLAVACDAQIGRPHIAQYMAQEGMVKDTATAFKKYLGNGKVGDVSCLWPSIETVVAWIGAAGGLAVLAHPHKYRMTASKRNRLIAYFASQGGRALEVSNANQPLDMVDILAKQCQRHGLLASAGSDYHGHQSWVRLGTYPRLPTTCQPIWQALP